LLTQQHEQSLRERSQAIDYQAVLARRRQGSPFIEIAQRLAACLGRTGGLSAFRSDELETLQQVHARLTRLNASLLDRAAAQARQRNIADIVFPLQQLHDERSP
jgi:hypothetical protein